MSELTDIILDIDKTDDNFPIIRNNKENLFLVAEMLFNESKYVDALRLSDLISQSDPEYIDAQLLSVRALSKIGDMEAALRKLLAMRQFAGEDDRFLGDLKQQLMVAVTVYQQCLATDNIPRAETICDILVELCPGRAMFLNAQVEIRNLLANRYAEKTYRGLRELADAYRQEKDLVAELSVRLKLAAHPIDRMQNSAARLDNLFMAISRVLGADIERFDTERIELARDLLRSVAAIPPMSVEDPDATDEHYSACFDRWYRMLLQSIDLDVIFGPQMTEKPPLPLTFYSASGEPLDIAAIAARSERLQTKLAFFAATSPEYFTRFAKTYVTSVLQKSGVNSMVFVCLCCPTAKINQVIDNFEIDDERLIFCCDDFDVSLNEYKLILATQKSPVNLPIYYAYAALLRADYMLKNLEVPVIVTGIDTLLQRGAADLLENFKHNDVVVNKIGSHFGLGGQLVNNITLTFPTKNGISFIEFLKYYSCKHLIGDTHVSFLDQIDIHMAMHHINHSANEPRVGYFDEFDMNNIMFDKDNYGYFRDMIQKYRFINIFAGGCEENPLKPNDLLGH